MRLKRGQAGEKGKGLVDGILAVGKFVSGFGMADGCVCDAVSGEGHGVKGHMRGHE